MNVRAVSNGSATTLSVVVGSILFSVYLFSQAVAQGIAAPIPVLVGVAGLIAYHMSKARGRTPVKVLGAALMVGGYAVAFEMAHAMMREAQPLRTDLVYWAMLMAAITTVGVIAWPGDRVRMGKGNIVAQVTLAVSALALLCFPLTVAPTVFAAVVGALSAATLKVDLRREAHQPRAMLDASIQVLLILSYCYAVLLQLIR